MRYLIALVSGLIFGLGLIVSGMINPAKIKGFLDLFGSWDPSLVLVMAGAIAVGVFAFAAARHRSRSWSGDPMQIPTSTVIDRRLIGGGILFGIGWGIGGFCPGPALVTMASGLRDAWIFGAAMLIGMALYDRLSSTR